MGSLFEASWGVLEASSGPRGTLWGPTGGILGRKAGIAGGLGRLRTLAPQQPPSRTAPRRAVYEERAAPCDTRDFRGSRPSPGYLFAYTGLRLIPPPCLGCGSEASGIPVWVLLACFSGASWSHFVKPLGASWGLFGGLLGPLLGLLGTSWGLLGPSWARKSHAGRCGKPQGNSDKPREI